VGRVKKGWRVGSLNYESVTHELRLNVGIGGEVNELVSGPIGEGATFPVDVVV